MSADEQRVERTGDVAIIVLVFVVLFGYDVLEAVTNLQQLPQLYAAYGMAESTPWWLLVTGVALPPVLLAAALWISRGMRLVPRAGVLLLGLAVSAQLALLLEELARQVAEAALG